MELFEKPLRLDLGCGNSPKESFDGVDLRAPAAKFKMDLLKFPWPWKDESVEEIYCSHFIEHIPNRDVEERDIIDSSKLDLFLGQDMLLAFFDEIYRVLKIDAVATIVWPALWTDRAYQDPTHRRFIPSQQMDYLSAAKRIEMGLQHYIARCNFSGTTSRTYYPDLEHRADAVRERLMRENLNQVVDYRCVLQKVRAGVFNAAEAPAPSP